MSQWMRPSSRYPSGGLNCDSMPGIRDIRADGGGAARRAGRSRADVARGARACRCVSSPRAAATGEWRRRVAHCDPTHRRPARTAGITIRKREARAGRFILGGDAGAGLCRGASRPRRPDRPHRLRHLRSRCPRSFRGDLRATNGRQSAATPERARPSWRWISRAGYREGCHSPMPMGTGSTSRTSSF